MQIRFCFESRFENSNFQFSCFLVVLIIELCFYMGLLQFALGLSKFKGESPKDSNSAKPRENHDKISPIISLSGFFQKLKGS